MNKKGFQLSLNVVVGAIIALIVLVSVTIFFAGKFGKTSNEMNKCASLSGDCVSADQCPGGRIVEATCPGEKDCCVKPCTLAGKTLTDDGDCENENGNGD
ncbi:MAG: hypothetical protein ACQESF_00230 [Nanobdellota archaeon]